MRYEGRNVIDNTIILNVKKWPFIWFQQILDWWIIHIHRYFWLIWSLLQIYTIYIYDDGNYKVSWTFHKVLMIHTVTGADTGGGGYSPSNTSRPSRVQGGTHGQILLRACTVYKSGSLPGSSCTNPTPDNFVFHTIV